MKLIKIEQVIIHRIDHHNYDRPLLSEQGLVLSEELRHLFSSLLIQNLEHGSLRIGKFQNISESTTTIKKFSDEIFAEPSHFVSCSQSIARHLFYSVARDMRIPPVALVICTFSEVGNSIITLAFLMMHSMDVFQASTERSNQQMYFKLEKVSGALTIGEVQKCAFIFPRELRMINEYDLKVLDNRVGGSDSHVASYFVDFLQCNIEPTKKVEMKLTFFISYSSKDSVVAKQISDALITSGYKTWLDKKDIKIGQFILDRVSKGIEKESDYVIILISRNSTESEWCRLELRMAYQKELAFKHIIVLPIRIDDADVPVEILTKKYYQLNPDSKTSLDSLIQEIIFLAKERGH